MYGDLMTFILNKIKKNDFKLCSFNRWITIFNTNKSSYLKLVWNRCD